MKTNFLRSQLIRFVLFMLVLFGLHLLIDLNFLEPPYSGIQFWRIYVFLVPIEILAILYIYGRFLKDPESVIKNFLGFVVIKVIASIGFLSPWLFYKDDSSSPMVFHFFAVFFPILIGELLFLVKMLNQPPEKNEKN